MQLGHAAIVALTMVAWPTIAMADDLPRRPPEACTVHKHCSSTGMACNLKDSACTNKAREKGLEIFCEGEFEAVYCPPITGHADSKAIWVLLAAAVTLGVGGTAVAWRLLRKRPEEPS